MHQVASHPHDSFHREHHFESTDTVRDIVIGLSDGLTVPFALAAGLGAVTSARLVVVAGLAEIAAGSIAMGLGGYLAARGDSEHYTSEREREQIEIVTRPEDEAAEIYEIFEKYRVPRAAATPVLRALQANPAAYVDFMMRFELGLEEPAANRAHRSALTIAASYIAGGFVPLFPYMILPSNAEALQKNHPAYVDFMMRFELGLEKPAPNRAHRSALTIAASYVAGGLVPLLPYMFVRGPYAHGGDFLRAAFIPDTEAALKLSVVITLLALAFFGAIKGRLVGTGALRSALQTTLIGGAAAAAAYTLARLLNHT